MKEAWNILLFSAQEQSSRLRDIWLSNDGWGSLETFMKFIKVYTQYIK